MVEGIVVPGGRRERLGESRLEMGWRCDFSKPALSDIPPSTRPHSPNSILNLKPSVLICEATEDFCLSSHHTRV